MFHSDIFYTVLHSRLYFQHLILDLNFYCEHLWHVNSYFELNVSIQICSECIAEDFSGVTVPSAKPLGISISEVSLWTSLQEQPSLNFQCTASFYQLQAWKCGWQSTGIQATYTLGSCSIRDTPGVYSASPRNTSSISHTSTSTPQFLLGLSITQF